VYGIHAEYRRVLEQQAAVNILTSAATAVGNALSTIVGHVQSYRCPAASREQRITIAQKQTATSGNTGVQRGKSAHTR